MTDWSPLRAALARCRADHIDVPFWWRDDDAIEPTGALDQLSELAHDLHMPAHLAVIPARAQTSLSDYLSSQPLLHPMVHGWAHHNTAPMGQKKSEFGVQRAGASDELARAIAQLQNLFGTQLIPVFVPPWNRIAPEITAMLPGLGYRAVSTFGPRPSDGPLPRINTHIDPIFWRGHRSLIDTDVLIAQTADILDARRCGAQDADEPFGFLTHHLVHDAEIWEFSRGFMAEMLSGGANIARI